MRLDDEPGEVLGGASGRAVVRLDGRMSDPMRGAIPLAGGIGMIPDESEHSSGHQNASDLGACGLTLEPVEGLGDRDRVHGRGRKGDALGRSQPRVDAHQLRSQDVEHRLGRLHGDDTVRTVHQVFGELSGSGTEIERRSHALREDPLDGSIGKSRSIPVVLLSDAPEGLCQCAMVRHGGDAITEVAQPPFPAVSSPRRREGPADAHACARTAGLGAIARYARGCR